ncbi:MarR family winged helix-turn-helix transcriptional regulator [Mycolicibacterium sp. J2]|uniref:MarR family winged helix-turn-helix transcriptional regulator n=1 Tax=Mycolicibacterium sp. J2 TaxID=2993511 RepID=UPI00224B319A|nr:MarR family transcriptional regulator [Mycolicibacterium sp. J2]MCX2714920.1 MarR family transcriptional regulator [Mycolicibacterium sp. J2]
MESPRSDDDARECIGRLLDDATDLTARFLSDRTELSASAAYAMHRVSLEGPIRLTALAAKEGVSQPSMTQLMQRLERADLVARVPDPDDGRACLIAITEQGQALLDNRRRTRRKRLQQFLASLSPEDEHALTLAASVASPILARLTTDADSATGPDVATDS